MEDSGVALKRKALKRASIFAPTPFDALVILAVAYWLSCAIASMSWYGNGYGDPRVFLLTLFSGLAAMLAALGAAVAIGKWNRDSPKYFASIVLVGVVFYGFFGWLTTKPDPFQSVGYANQSNFFIGDSTVWFWTKAFVALSGSFLLPFLIVHLIRFAGGYLWDFGRKFRGNRTRNLVIFACALFVLAKIQTLFGGTGNSPAMGKPPMAVAIMWAVLIYSLAALLFVFIPSRLLTSRKLFAVKFFATIVLSILLGVLTRELAWDSPWPWRFSISWLVAASVFPLIYFSSFLACACETTPTVDQSSKGRLRPVGQGRPSIWAYLFVAPIVVTTGVGLYFFEPAFFLNNLGSPVWARSSSAPSPFELAQLSRRVGRESGGAVRLAPDHYSAYWLIDAQSHHDPNCLAKIPIPKSTIEPNTIVIKNMDATIDAGPLRNWTQLKRVSLLSGSFTNQQLDDLYTNCQYAFIAGQIDFPVSVDPKIPVPSLRFVGQQAYPIAEMLDRLICKKGNNDIVVEFPVLVEDWDAIVRASQFRKVRIHSDLPLEIYQRGIPKGAWSNISIFLRTHPGNNLEMLQRIANSGATISHFGGGTDLERWQLSFAFPQISEGGWNKLGIPSIPDPEFVKLARHYGWAFDWDDSNDITKIWMPDTVPVAEHLAVLGELRTLRMDVRGINGSVGIGAGLIDGNVLKKLTKLEQLYLPSEIQLDDLTFLKSLKQLTHLQIAAQDRTLQTGTGFEVCNALRSLQFFGTPDVQTVSELAQLKELKRLVIIDDLGDFGTPELIEAFKTKLPGVEMQVVAPEDFQPDTAGDFGKHVKGIRESLLRSLKSGDAK